MDLLIIIIRKGCDVKCEMVVSVLIREKIDKAVFDIKCLVRYN